MVWPRMASHGLAWGDSVIRKTDKGWSECTAHVKLISCNARKERRERMHHLKWTTVRNHFVSDESASRLLISTSVLLSSKRQSDMLHPTRERLTDTILSIPVKDTNHRRIGFKMVIKSVSQTFICQVLSFHNTNGHSISHGMPLTLLFKVPMRKAGL